ncbi:MAG: helix-turn-helix transcriptional regulator [Clostridiales bacterium]|nr:helix-turn-helix transcriptional regulator [Clostridiales bacterium]
MENFELEQCKRFKELRKALKLKQGELAESLTISQGHTSDIENGRKAVSDRIIEILVLKYNVNANWIRDGQGEMFKKMNRKEEISNFAVELFTEEEDSFKNRLVSVLASLNENEWEVLENIAERLIKQKKD